MICLLILSFTVKYVLMLYSYETEPEFYGVIKKVCSKGSSSMCRYDFCVNKDVLSSDRCSVYCGRLSTSK